MIGYTEFLVNEYGRFEVHNQKKAFFQTLGKQALNESDYAVFNLILNEGDVNRLYSIMESADSEALFEGFLNEESLLAKAKEKVAAVAQKVKEKGKEALDKVSDGTKALVKMGGDLLKPIKMILAKIAEAFKKMWAKVQEIGKSASEKAKEEIRPKVKAAIQKNPGKLVEESKNLATMGAWGATYFGGGAFVGELGKSAETAAKEDGQNESLTIDKVYEASIFAVMNQMLKEGEYTAEQMVEALSPISTGESLDNLFEGGGSGIRIPFVSAVFDKIGHTAPFKWFHKIGEKAGKIANNTLEKVSYFVANALNGPGPFKFIVIGGIVGAVAGWAAEYGAKSALHTIIHAVEHALHIAIPGMSFIFTAIKYTGYALLIYGLIQEIFLKEDPEKAKELPKKAEDAGEKDKEEEKKEEK